MHLSETDWSIEQGGPCLGEHNHRVLSEILGLEVRSHRSQVLPRVGALVESPALYGYLSGRDNLRAVGNLLGGASEKRIDEVLEIVALKRPRSRSRQDVLHGHEAAARSRPGSAQQP